MKCNLIPKIEYITFFNFIKNKIKIHEDFMKVGILPSNGLE